MSTETRYRIVTNNTPAADDALITADQQTADYIAEAIAYQNEDNGESGNVKAVRADLVEGPRADLVANVRVATGELNNANIILANAIENVSNIDVAARTVHSLATVLASAALELHEHDEWLEPEVRGY